MTTTPGGLEKKVDLAETSAHTSDGRVFLRLNPLKRDITLNLEIQAVKIGNNLWVQFSKLNIDAANIINIEEIQN